MQRCVERNRVGARVVNGGGLQIRWLSLRWFNPTRPIFPQALIAQPETINLIKIDPFWGLS